MKIRPKGALPHPLDAQTEEVPVISEAEAPAADYYTMLAEQQKQALFPPGNFEYLQSLRKDG